MAFSIYVDDVTSGTNAQALYGRFGRWVNLTKVAIRLFTGKPYLALSGLTVVTLTDVLVKYIFIS